MQYSFYITDEILLRTTYITSAGTRPWNHVMVKVQLKLFALVKCIVVFFDATHSHQFTQIEGLVVDKNVKMSDLKGTLELLAKKLFGADREIRLDVQMTSHSLNLL
ncbi:tRNA ligase subunit PheS family protein [Staphylococcus aureus]